MESRGASINTTAGRQLEGLSQHNWILLTDSREPPPGGSYNHFRHAADRRGRPLSASQRCWTCVAEAAVGFVHMQGQMSRALTAGTCKRGFQQAKQEQMQRKILTGNKYLFVSMNSADNTSTSVKLVSAVTSTSTQKNRNLVSTDVDSCLRYQTDTAHNADLIKVWFNNVLLIILIMTI